MKKRISEEQIIGFLTSGLPVELFDPQAPLEAFEEQLHLQSITMQLRDFQRRQEKVVGQKYEALAGLRIVESDAAQWRFDVLV